MEEIYLSERMATIVLEMEEVCFSNSMGPDNDELINWIWVHYPQLKERFGYIRPQK